MIIKNEAYSLSLGKDGAITSLIARGKEFAGTVVPLFSFRLRKGADARRYTSSDAKDIRIFQADGSAVLSFEGFDGADIAFEVRAACGKRIEWRFSFDNRSDFLVEWICCPQLALPKDLVAQGGSGRLLFNFNEGVLIEDYDLRQKTWTYVEPEYPSNGLNTVFPAVVQSQFLAYYDDNAGIYFAAEDAARGVKGVDFVPLDGGFAGMEIRVFPGTAEKQYTLPYPLVYDFFKGDWYDAASLYRAWFEDNLPEGLKKVTKADDLPEWYFDSPLIVTYPVQGIHDMDVPAPNALFPYENALPHLERIAKATKSRVMALLMHWEGTAPWAPPYVWPPLGGEKMLSDFGKALHERGFLLGVYCSGLGYTIHSNLNDYSCEEIYEKDHLSRFMCTAPDGKTIDSHICQGQRKSYDICVSTDFAKQTLHDEAEKMASSGLDYIQILDQNHGGTPYFCCSPDHGHVPAPGPWMVNEMKTLLQGLKDAVGKDVLLGCESASSEAYLPYLKLSDNRFNLNYRHGRTVPLYAFLYHSYLHNFSGNSVSSLDITDIHASPDCFLQRIAHSAMAGDLMTLVINQKGEIVWSWGERDFSVLPDADAALRFISNVTALRRGEGRKYLVSGRMEKPLETECGTLPLYKTQFPGYAVDYPKVITSRFTAEDGTDAQFFANYTSSDVTVRVALDGHAVTLTGEDGGKTAFDGNDAVFTVPAFAVIMMQIR